jgi:uncharacterized protein YdeI (YjbR/CyaY-like superfamily)
MNDKLIFKTRKDFRNWLSESSSNQGVWLVFGKDESIVTLTAPEALEEALCFGWIDGLIKKIDESSYMKYFSPRRKGSQWSDKNRKLANKLIDENLMTSKGLIAIELAKENGLWEAKQDRDIPEEQYQAFEILIGDNSAALENYRKMPKSLKFQFVGLYFDAKREETRIKRLEKLIDLLERNKKPI